MANKKEQCWKPNSKTETVLLVFLILFIVATISLAVALILTSQSDKICTSKECIEAAHDILSSMDPSVDPCVDFYQFACGGFANTTNSLQYSPISKTGERRMDNMEQLRKIINQPWKTSEPRYYKLVKDLYTSCMNESKIEELGASPLYSMLEEVGGWPVIAGSDWKENDFDWRQTLVQFYSMGTSFTLFFNLAVKPNLQHSKQFILKIGEPSVSLPKEYYSKKMHREKYLKLMIDVAILLGADKTRAEREMKVVLDFEAKISEFLMPREERRNVSKFQNEFRVHELQRLMPQISWVQFLNSLKFPREINRYDKVVVDDPNSLVQLSILLSNTNKRIISNYMLWRIVMGHCRQLHKKLGNRCNEFYDDLYGMTDPKTRQYYCISNVIGRMNVATGAIFAQKLFDPESKTLASNLVNNIKNILTHSMSSAKWMDSETLEKAIEKLKKMKELVAYPEELLDDAVINSFYYALKISENQYFSNLLRTSKFITNFSFSLLNKKVDDTNWIQFADSATANAFHLFSYNRIQIHAGLLGGVFFNSHWPKYLNYGGIGTVIGHEFIHGFDDIGKQFGHNGNLNNWWANETAKKFREKADLIVKQYSSFKVPEVNMTLKGVNVQGEAISDIEGTKLAYKAYEKWEKKNGKESGLPGLSLNSRQLFWLKTANVWCSNLPEESLKHQILNGHHPPSRYRVIGPIINSEYFGNDFNCQVGSPMNPKQKLSLW